FNDYLSRRGISFLDIGIKAMGLESVSIQRIQGIGYGVLGFLHGYVVSSLMDTAYWSSE
ncbi:hypothetical protein Tco_0980928, partial [Tanacetum coccineum]